MIWYQNVVILSISALRVMSNGTLPSLFLLGLFYLLLYFSVFTVTNNLNHWHLGQEKQKQQDSLSFSSNQKKKHLKSQGNCRKQC